MNLLAMCDFWEKGIIICANSLLLHTNAIYTVTLLGTPVFVFLEYPNTFFMRKIVILKWMC